MSTFGSWFRLHSCQSYTTGAPFTSQKHLKSAQIMALEFNGKSKMKTDPTSKNKFESLAIWSINSESQFETFCGIWKVYPTLQLHASISHIQEAVHRYCCMIWIRNILYSSSTCRWAKQQTTSAGSLSSFSFSFRFSCIPTHPTAFPWSRNPLVLPRLQEK